MLSQMYLDNNVQEKNLLQWCINTPGDNLAQVKTLCNVVCEAQDNNAQEKISIMDIIFWYFLILYQIFFSPQVKWSMIISNKYGIYKFPYELPNDLRFGS